MNISFKIASKDDIHIIHQLANKIWKEHYRTIISIEQIEYMLAKMYSEESLLKQIEEGHRFTFICLDDLPVGFISVSKMNEQHYFLHKFYVNVSRHRLGLGSKLFQCILSQLPSGSTIELTVNRQNYHAINFYFKNGFVIKKIADFDIGNGYYMNDFVMIRK